MVSITIDEVQLPTNIERSAVGGPGFSTTLVQLDNGNRQANQNWEQPLGQWTIGYGIMDRTNYSIVLAFMYARRGQARGFLFKDWADFEFTAQTLGTGDDVETDFQVTKLYTDTVAPFTRTITRPDESSMTVYIDGSPISSSLWTLVAGGIIRFTTPPVTAEVVSASGEFNVPVQFNIDLLTVQLDWREAGTVPTFPIIEVRDY